MNVKQEAFCLHYAQTGNATESYKKAGYTAKTEGAVYANANRLLKNDKVQARLKELAAEIKTDKIANIKEIQERLTAIMRGEEGEERTMFKDGEPETYTVVNQQNQIKCAELLAKMQGGFDSSVNVKMGVTIIDDIGE